MKLSLPLMAFAALLSWPALAGDAIAPKPNAPTGACTGAAPCILQLTPGEVALIEQALASAPIPANASVPLIQKIDGQRLLQQRESEKAMQK